MNRELLEKPFDPSQIKQRKGTFGEILDYVEGHAVIQRLNDAFDGNWSFEVVDYKILEREVLILGKLSANGVVKMQFGSSKITKAKEDGSIISLGDDLKAGATDSLKKAATLLGVGLHLYREEGEAAKGHGQKEEKPRGEGRLTNQQLTAILSLAKQKGMTQREIQEQSLAQFSKSLEYLSQKEASRLIRELQAG